MVVSGVLGWSTCSRHNMDAVRERVGRRQGMPKALGIGTQGEVQRGLIALHVQIGDVERCQFTQRESTAIDFRNPLDRPADHRRIQFGIPLVLEAERSAAS